MDTWQKYLAEHRGRQEAWDRDQAAWVAEQEDAQHAADSFTGAAWDTVTLDYSAWLCGHRIGWARSASEAEALVRDQLAREIDHRTVPT